MRRRVLESSIITLSTSGLAQVCGPSEDRVALILCQPSTGANFYAPTGFSSSLGSFAATSAGGPLVVTYEAWGTIVKAGWEVNTFGTQRSILAIEVLERWVDDLTTVAQEKPQERQATAEEQPKTQGLTPLSQQKRRSYRKQGILG